MNSRQIDRWMEREPARVWRMTATVAPSDDPPPWSGWDATSWLVTFTLHGRALEVPYWQGLGIVADPDPVGVALCLALDLTVDADEATDLGLTPTEWEWLRDHNERVRVFFGEDLGAFLRWAERFDA